MPPQQSEKRLPGPDKRESRLQAVTKESLLKSQLNFTGRNLDIGKKGMKKVKLFIGPCEGVLKIWLELEQPRPSIDGFITLGKQIKIINLIS